MRKLICSVFALLLVAGTVIGQPGYIGDVFVHGPHFTSGGSTILVQERRNVPNDYWVNNNFSNNFFASDNGRPLSDGSLATGQKLDPNSWACWWIRDEFIDLERAWAIQTGDTNIVLAISDIEVTMDHPALFPNLMHNPGELGGVAGVDDDGNGLIDDIRGWNFAGWDNLVSPPIDDLSAMQVWMTQGSTNQHGTQMAGIIGERGNDEPWPKQELNYDDKRPGSTGILWNANIYPIRSLKKSTAQFDATPHGMRTTGLYSVMGNSNQNTEYLCWLKDEGIMDIRVLSMSWVRQTRYMVARCIESGILPVTGSGNSGTLSGVNPISAMSDSILVMGGVNADGVSAGNVEANFGPGVSVCGWTNPTSGSNYFNISSWSNPIPEGTWGWNELNEGYNSNPHYFTPGFMSRGDWEGVNLNIDWEPNFKTTTSYPSWTVQYGRNPSPMYTSGATAEGAGVAMLIFSTYPELGPLQCIAMIERGASTSIYDGRNDASCDGGGCGDLTNGLIGAGALNAYRALTLWGDVSDTTLSGTVYVSGDVNLGDNVSISASTVFKISPVDIYSNEINLAWLDCQAQYEITDILDNKPADLLETTEIFISGAVATGANIRFESFARIPNTDDWGGIWIQAGGSIDDRDYSTTGTLRGD